MEVFFVLFTLGRSASELILIFLEELDLLLPLRFLSLTWYFFGVHTTHICAFVLVIGRSSL